MRKVCATIVVGICLAVAASWSSVASGQTQSCDLNVPALKPAPAGVQVDPVVGSCTFSWHSLNQVMFKDRWHVLGQDWKAGGPANVTVTQPGYVEEYTGCGYWKLRMLIYHGQTKVLQVTGPTTWFCAA